MGRLSRRYRLLALFGLGIVVLAISSLALGHVIGHRCGGWSGCDASGLPLGSVRVRDLETHKEATLYYPAATLLAHGSTAEQHHLLASPGSAYSSSILATADTADNVYAWYGAWLSAHGWRNSDVIRSTAELSVRGWRRGSREVVDVSILDPVRWTGVNGRATQPGETLVRTLYGIFPAGG